MKNNIKHFIRILKNNVQIVISLSTVITELYNFEIWAYILANYGHEPSGAKLFERSVYSIFMQKKPHWHTDELNDCTTHNSV